MSLRGRGRADGELVRVGRRADLDWAALTNALVDRARSEVRSRDARALERRRRTAAFLFGVPMAVCVELPQGSGPGACYA